MKKLQDSTSRAHKEAIYKAVQSGSIRAIDATTRAPVTNGNYIYIHRDDAIEYLKRCGFVAQTEATSESDHLEDRQKRMQSVVDRHGGNKSAAARELGMTRQRVGQILKPKASASGLCQKPNDPFGIALKVVSSKTSKRKS